MSNNPFPLENMAYFICYQLQLEKNREILPPIKALFYGVLFLRKYYKYITQS